MPIRKLMSSVLGNYFNAGIGESYYYSNYEVTYAPYELSDSDRKLLDAAIYIVDNNATIREASRNFDYCKSTLHKQIHNKLKGLSYELYKCVTRVLTQHNRR